jgi:hypothetical protein
MSRSRMWMRGGPVVWSEPVELGEALAEQVDLR